MSEERLAQYAVFGKWLLIALVTGPVCALTVYGFVFLLDLIIDFTPSIISAAPFLTPLLGGILVGVLVLHRFPGAGGDGIPSYLTAVNRNMGRISAVDTFLKIPATLLTLGFHGSGGIVGPLARIGAGLGNITTRAIFRLFHIHERGSLRIATICGVSAVVSTIFHAPLGGGIFAAEILARNSMHYSDLFPSVLTGCAAYITSAFILGQEPVFTIGAPAAPPPSSFYAWLPVTALVAGVISIFFVIVHEKTDTVMKKIPGGRISAAAAAGLALSLLWLMRVRWSLGLSHVLFGSLLTGKLSGLSVAILDAEKISLLIFSVIMIKIFATSITIGGGMSAGFTAPMIIVGLGSGALIASITGTPAGSPEYYLLMACGMSAVLGAALNIPIAAIIITTRLFGPDYVLASATGGILAFIVFKRRTLYEYSLTPWLSDLDDEEIEA